jgi:hypothetical protein
MSNSNMNTLRRVCVRVYIDDVRIRRQINAGDSNCSVNIFPGADCETHYFGEATNRESRSTFDDSKMPPTTRSTGLD